MALQVYQQLWSPVIISLSPPPPGPVLLPRIAFPPKALLPWKVIPTSCTYAWPYTRHTCTNPFQLIYDVALRLGQSCDRTLLVFLPCDIHVLDCSGEYAPMSSADLPGSDFDILEPSAAKRFAEVTAVACLISIAWYNSFELIILCFSTFKRYGGLYFWCLLISSISILPFGLGYLLIIFNVYNHMFSVAMELVAWTGMVTGQSLVLWSRLHLIVQNRRILRGTLIMIFADLIIFHVPGSILELGSHSNKHELFDHAFNIFERIQLVGFSIQEMILSIIYSIEAIRLLNLRPRGHYRGTLVQLLIVNLAMIMMDAAVIGVQYAGRFDIHVALKALSYSIKLKLEYAILGKLVHFTEMSPSSSVPTDLSDFVDLSYQPDQSPADSDSQARIYGSPESPLQHRVQVASKPFWHGPSRSVTAGTPISREDV